MVNFGFGLAGFVGIALVAAGVGLYVLRSIRPTLARDHDIFFAAVALLCGGILMFQGWRLDPILLFGQFLMTGSAAFFAVESIRLRGIVTQQAKRTGGSPIDEERTVSSAYQTYNDYDDDVEELEPLDEYPPVRRIPGTRDNRRPVKEAYEDDPRRRPANRRPSSTNRPATGAPPRKRPDRPVEESRRSPRSESWDNSGYDDRDSSTYDDRYTEKPSNAGSSRPTNGRGDAPPKPKRPRPSPSYRADDIEATPVDYVDYRPSKKPSLDKDDAPVKGYSDYSDYSDYSSDYEDERPDSRPTSQPPTRDPQIDRSNDRPPMEDDEYRPPVRSNPKKNVDVTPPPKNYDDYQPVNYGDDEDDNSDNFDD